MEFDRFQIEDVAKKRLLVVGHRAGQEPKNTECWRLDCWERSGEPYALGNPVTLLKSIKQ